MDKDIIRFVKTYTREHGYPPSYREIAEALNCSLTTMHYRLAVMKAEGKISFESSKPRTITVKGGKP